MSAIHRPAVPTLFAVGHVGVLMDRGHVAVLIDRGRVAEREGLAYFEAT